MSKETCPMVIDVIKHINKVSRESFEGDSVRAGAHVVLATATDWSKRAYKSGLLRGAIGGSLITGGTILAGSVIKKLFFSGKKEDKK